MLDILKPYIMTNFFFFLPLDQYDQDCFAELQFFRGVELVGPLTWLLMYHLSFDEICSEEFKDEEMVEPKSLDIRNFI